MIDRTLRRRQFLRLGGVAVAGALAGCAAPTRRSPTKLVPDGLGETGVVGESVALSGDGTTALVGNTIADGPTNPFAGSAHVFSRESDEWTGTATLVPEDDESNASLGWAVDLSRDGTTALVADYQDSDPNGEEAGAAYLFLLTDGGWTRTAKLAPDDGDETDLFGLSAALSGDGTTAILGAPGDEVPNGTDPVRAGSASVFTRAGGWSEAAKLVPDDGDTDDGFGGSVALSGDGATALVGASGDEGPGGTHAGSAYVYARDGGSWRQRARLTADDGDAADRFGFSVALSGDGTTALVGAVGDEDPNGETEIFAGGSAYVFARDGGTWTQVAKLAPDDGDPIDRFGHSVALTGDGSTALVGAPGDRDRAGWTDAADGAGSAYVFRATDGDWTGRAKLYPADSGPADLFGESVGLSDDCTTALVGAPGPYSHDFDGGAPYVFDLERT